MRASTRYSRIHDDDEHSFVLGIQHVQHVQHRAWSMLDASLRHVECSSKTLNHQQDCARAGNICTPNSVAIILQKVRAQTFGSLVQAPKAVQATYFPPTEDICLVLLAPLIKARPSAYSEYINAAVNAAMAEFARLVPTAAALDRQGTACRALTVTLVTMADTDPACIVLALRGAAMLSHSTPNHPVQQFEPTAHAAVVRPDELRRAILRARCPQDSEPAHPLTAALYQTLDAVTMGVLSVIDEREPSAQFTGRAGTHAKHVEDKRNLWVDWIQAAMYNVVVTVLEGLTGNVAPTVPAREANRLLQCYIRLKSPLSRFGSTVDEMTARTMSADLGPQNQTKVPGLQQLRRTRRTGKWWTPEQVVDEYLELFCSGTAACQGLCCLAPEMSSDVTDEVAEMGGVTCQEEVILSPKVSAKKESTTDGDNPQEVAEHRKPLTSLIETAEDVLFGVRLCSVYLKCI